MGAKALIKSVMEAKRYRVSDLTKGLNDRGVQITSPSLSSQLYRDHLLYDRVEQIADVMGCDICFRDRRSGKVYRVCPPVSPNLPSEPITIE